jgi:hypothetical protein
MSFAALHESGFGTKPTSRNVRWLVAFGAKPILGLINEYTP